MKSQKKIVVAGITGVILLFFGLFGARIYLGTDHARRLILTEINKNIPGTISWRENRVSFFKGGVDLTDVLLQGPSGDLLIALERMCIDISWLELITGRLIIESVFLEKPQVFLEDDKTGTLNLVNAFVGDEESSPESSGMGFPFNIILRKALIHGGSMQYSLNAHDRIVFPDIDLELRNGNLFKQEATLLLGLTHSELIMGGETIGLESINLRTSFVKDRFDSLHAILKTSGKSVLTVTGHIRNLFGDIRPELELNLEGDASDILKTVLLDLEITGDISAHLKTRGTLNDQEATLALKYRGGDIAGNRIDHADISCRLEKRVVTVDKSLVKAPYGTFHLNGDINLQHVFPDGFLSSQRDPNAAVYKIFITQQDMLLEKLPAIPAGVTGLCQAKATLNGKGFSASTLSAQLSLELSAENFGIEEVFQSKESSLLTLIAGIEKNRLAIKHFEVNSGKNRVSARGEYDLHSREIDGKLSVFTKFPAEEFFLAETESAQGELTLNLWISGKPEKPLIKGHLEGEGIGYHGINLGGLSGDILFSDGRLSFERMSIRNPPSALDIEGSVQLFDYQTNQMLQDPLVEIGVYGEKLFLEGFLDQMKGEIFLEGSLSGSIAFPTGTIRLKGKNIDLGMQKIQGVTLGLHLDGERLFVDECRAEFAAGEEIQAEGWISLDGKYDLYAASEGISLNHIDQIADQDWRTAALFFDFQGTGSFEDPRLSGNIGLRGLQLNEEQMDPFSLKVDVVDWKAGVEGEKEISVKAELNLKTREITGELRSEALDLAPWFKLAGHDELDGILGGGVTVTGNLNALDQMRMQAQISRLEVGWRQKELLQVSDLTIGLANGILRIPKNRLSFFKEGYLDVSGKAEVNGMLDFKADGKVPMGVTELFFDEVSETKGMITCRASVSGTRENPIFYADLGFEKIGFQVSYFSEPLQELSGRLRFASDRITAENIKGKFATGSFDLEGNVELKNDQPDSANVSLTAHALPILAGDHTELLLNTDLTIRGTQKESAITGEIVILEGTYTRDVDLNPLGYVVSQSRDEKPAIEKEEASFFDNTTFDIIVQNRNPFVVDNNIALLSLRPDFHFQGTLDRPLISGRARVESGIIKYQGQEFEVTRGIIDFINPYRIEPSIDLEGRTQVREWIIFLGVKGTVENLEFRLRSDPPEQDGDILSLLAFGKTLREFTTGEGGQSSSPAEILAGLMSERIQADIKDATGLDTVHLQYKSSDAETETGQVMVEVGKELSRQVAVKYGVETRNSKVVRRTMTEYRLLENLILDAYQDSEGDYGGGLQYRLEFR
ncbi:MAG: translocation/assembly module TamB domain-containing protein [Desulfobacterales bacterium]